MFLLCNYYKKLLSIFTAVRTITLHPYLGTGNFKTFFTADIFFNLLTHRALKLNDFTTAEAHQVMVFCRWLDFIMVVLIIEMELLNQL